MHIASSTRAYGCCRYSMVKVLGHQVYERHQERLKKKKTQNNFPKSSSQLHSFDVVKGQQNGIRAFQLLIPLDMHLIEIKNK